MSENKIFIPEYVKKQIDYLHLGYPDKEWSGMLAYTVEKLELGKEISIRVQGIYPMDLGKASYTEFDYENKIAEVYDIFEKRGITIEDLKVGLIHSHHNMKSYFSGTDTKEISNNAKKHNYYLSLVVSTDENYAAKLAFPSKVEITENHKILNTKGEEVSIPKSYEKESLIAIDLEPVIEQEFPLDDWFKDRVEELKKETRATTSYGYGGRYGYERDWRRSYDREYSAYERSDPTPWKKSNGGQLSLPYSKKEKEKDEVIEEFVLELCEVLFGTKFHSIYGLVRKCMTTTNLGAMFVGFDTAFNKLYIKHFGSKPATEEELDEVLSDIIILLDAEEVGLLDTLTVTEDNNLLDGLKECIYGKLTE